MRNKKVSKREKVFLITLFISLVGIGIMLLPLYKESLQGEYHSMTAFLLVVDLAGFFVAWMITKIICQHDNKE